MIVYISLLFLLCQLAPAQGLGQEDTLFNRDAVKTQTETTPAYDSLVQLLEKSETDIDQFTLFMQLGKMALDLRLYGKKTSFQYYLKAYHLAEKLNEPSALTSSCLKIAHLYKRIDQYDSCYVYCQKAIALGKKNFELNPAWLAESYWELGSYYYKIVDYGKNIYSIA